jgi:putative effector of murein hydrolase LrgA (UPF0299 family)
MNIPTTRLSMSAKTWLAIAAVVVFATIVVVVTTRLIVPWAQSKSKTFAKATTPSGSGSSDLARYM